MKSDSSYTTTPYTGQVSPCTDFLPTRFCDGFPTRNRGVRLVELFVDRSCRRRVLNHFFRLCFLNWVFESRSNRGCFASTVPSVGWFSAVKVAEEERSRRAGPEALATAGGASVKMFSAVERRLS